MNRLIVASLLAVVCPGAVLASGSVAFTEHLLQDGFGYAFGLSAADLNGDGRPEIIAADAAKGQLSCFVNQGNGQFQRFFIAQGEQGWLERNAIGDVSGDGKPDVVVVDNKLGQLLWFRNPGKPIETQRWTRNVISAELPHAYDVCLADFYGNGRLDAAATTWISNQVVLFDNPGGGSGPWVKHILDDSLGTARIIRAADFNGDGRPDLLATGQTGNLVVWYENPGAIGQPWTKHVIDSTSISPLHGQPIDMNGDGKMDVVMAFGTDTGPSVGEVCWYENLGNGLRWKKHIIAGSFPSGTSAVAGDLNGDGKLDVVAAAWGPNGRVAWFENPGDPTGVWTAHVLKQNWAKADQVLVVDLDGDGRLDIVASAERGSNEVRWWHNEGAAMAPKSPTAALLTSRLLALRVLGKGGNGRAFRLSTEPRR